VLAQFALQYGFVPERNPHDGLAVPLMSGGSAHVEWSSVATASQTVRDACAAHLAAMPTSLAYDVQMLRELQARESAADDDDELCVALRYRIAKKQLLSAVSGAPAASAATSAFAVQ
jgi:hypothetical protein